MTPIIVIAGIVGVVWAVVLLRHGDLIAACLAVLLVGSVFGHAFFHVSALTADRLLIVALVVAYGCYRRCGWADPKPWNKADAALVLFLGALTVSTFSHNWRLAGGQPFATLLFFFLLPATLYWVGRQAKLTEHSVLMLLGGLAVFAVYLALTAVAETRQAWSFVFPRYIVSSLHEEFFGRGRGPFLNPVGCGMFMCVGLFGAATWWPRLSRPHRAALLLMGAIILGGVYCTLTRSVWLGAALGMLLIVWLAGAKRWRLPMLVAALLVGTALIALKGDALNAFKRDKHVSLHDMSQSAKLRPILAAVAWKMFLDRPLLGCGFGQYKQVDIDYLRESVGDLPLEMARPYVQHNTFLALLTQTGLIGAGLWVVVLGLWTRSALLLCNSQAAPRWARQHALVFLAVLVAYVCNAMFHDVGLITMFNALLFLLAGVAQGLTPHIAPVRRATGANRIPRTPVAAASGA